MIRDFTLSAQLLLILACAAGCSSSEPTAADRADTSPPPAIDEPASATNVSNDTNRSPTSLAPAAAATDSRSLEPASDPDTNSAAGKPEYRLDAEPPEFNAERLAAAGIHVLQSRRLILLTDRDPESVRDLPPLVDQFFEFLEANCGPLRPSRTGTEFQATGFLMVDFERFQSAGFVPGPVVSMNHGQQLGYRFWMRDQATDYYRRHLLLHEFAHVYMTCDTGLHDIGAPWFMEGAAEVFATHTIADQSPLFAILPADFDGMENWGRISTIRRARDDRPKSDVVIQSIPALNSVRFPQGALATDEARYSWWWAMCWMLRSHPDYTDDWAALCVSRGAREFGEIVQRMEQRHGARLAADWLLFADCVTEAFDVKRSFPKHARRTESTPASFSLAADRGWQDSGWSLNAGDTIELSVTGECVLAATSAPWVSQPNGITLEYNQGRPLGETMAVLVGAEAGWISCRIAAGDNITFTTPESARLWLQINDDAGDRADNSGSYTVHIRRTPTGSFR